MKRDKIIYYIATGLLTLLMSFSAGMYFFNNAAIQGAFTSLGYPTYLIYPLATLKLLGIVAIWTKLSPRLKEWAYVGFFFDFVLAASAHIAVGDGSEGVALFGLVILAVSYIFDKRVFGKVVI